jgi:hypothetical protein
MDDGFVSRRRWTLVQGKRRLPVVHWDAVCAEARTSPAQGWVAFRGTTSGRPGRSSRGSRVAYQPDHRCRSAIDRASR